MTTLLITLEYPPFNGGVAHYYGHLVSHSSEAIKVMTNEDNKLLDPRWPVWRWLPSLYWIARAIKVKQISYILVGHILPIGTAVWLLSLFLPIRYTVFLHGLDFKQALTTKRKKFLAQQILTHAHQIISANSRTAGEVKELLTAKNWGKVHIVNPGINIKQIPLDEPALANLRQHHHLNHKTILLSIGRLVPRNGFDAVIKAMPQILATNSQVVYVIIGAGEQETELKILINELHLEASVLIFDNVDDNEKHLWLRLSDIFIMVSRDNGVDYEGFGIVYLEAGLYGKPVIASQNRGVSDAVLNDITGLLVESDNLTEITEAVVKLVKYPHLRLRLGDAGRERALKDFNWDKQAKKIENIIHKN